MSLTRVFVFAALPCYVALGWVCAQSISGIPSVAPAACATCIVTTSASCESRSSQSVRRRKVLSKNLRRSASAGIEWIRGLWSAAGPDACRERQHMKAGRTTTATVPDQTRNDVDFADRREKLSLTGGQPIKIALFLGLARLLQRMNLVS